MSVAVSIQSLESIVDGVLADPGLRASIPVSDINGGAQAARLMNGVIAQAIQRTGVNTDGMITPEELMQVSDAIRADPELYAQFLEGHGDDEWNMETGFHLVQGDGGTLRFQGRAYVNTIADAIYHIGFTYANGRFVNEDGDANEEVADVAGWLNWFLNGTNTVFGTAGADELYSGEYSGAFSAAADETFMAGDGNDRIWAGTGNDTVHAGDGNDTSGGGDGDDTMYGEAGDDQLYGDGGNDTIHGGDGADQIGGGNGNDRLVGNAGNDTIGGGAGNDSMAGGWGDDTMWGDSGHDVMSGQDGADTMGGGLGNDVMRGGLGNDRMWGEDGDDRLFGDEGDDEIGGGSGNDVIYGGDGSDEIGGQAGADRIFGEAGDDTVWAGQGNDWVTGGAGNDILGGDEGNDTVNGQDGNDTLYGGLGNDRLFGAFGNDRLLGMDGADYLYGGAGNDDLSGGEGADHFFGGTGRDLMSSWDTDNARDTFHFSIGDSSAILDQADQIAGFASGEDRIDLRTMSGLSYTGATLAGGGQASVCFDGDYLLIDHNGDGTADMAIELLYVNSIRASDLLLA